MIFLLAPSAEVAQQWLARKKLDPDSVAMFYSKMPDEEFRKLPTYDPVRDTIIALPESPDDLMFDITVR
jgi:hypothetical protein